MIISGGFSVYRREIGSATALIHFPRMPLPVWLAQHILEQLAGLIARECIEIQHIAGMTRQPVAERLFPVKNLRQFKSDAFEPAIRVGRFHLLAEQINRRHRQPRLAVCVAVAPIALAKKRNLPCSTSTLWRDTMRPIAFRSIMARHDLQESQAVGKQ